MGARFLLGIDVGGTFTDFVLLDPQTGQIVTSKYLSTPQDPSVGITAGLMALLKATGIPPDSIWRLVHGMTVVTNTIIERRGAKTGLLTNRGFRDILEVGAERRFDLYDVTITRPEPLVPRALISEVNCRIYGGRELQPVCAADVLAAVERLLEQGVGSLAVSLLHAPANPSHEYRLREIVRKAHPEIPVTLSSEVSPEIREYERTSTAVANAYVQPLVVRYLSELETRLHDLGVRANLFLMLSNGGLATPERAREVPIHLIESGPAGGTIAASYLAALLHEPNLLAFDMGGTTAKMSLVTGGVPNRANDFEAARAHRFKRGSGIPLRVPVIDLIEIGAGGGSIAWIDPLGLLRVGPRSAGAMPGPAAYQLGGLEPTVTDADIVLGYIDPGHFLGGEMLLSRDAAEQAIRNYIADALEVNVQVAAKAIIDAVDENMAIAARMYAAEKGVDLSDYTVVAFGGAGPVHATRLARLLRARRVLCPASAGTLAALGFLLAEPRCDLARIYVTPLDTLDWDLVNALYREMEEEARRVLHGAGVANSEVTLERAGDLRYTGQGHEISSPIPLGILGPGSREEIVDSFSRHYERVYGHSLPDAPMEAISWRLTARGRAPRFGAFRSSQAEHKDGPNAIRPVFYAEVGEYLDTPVYDRMALPVETRLTGPVLIQDVDSTIVAGPQSVVTIDQGRNVVIDLQ